MGLDPEVSIGILRRLGPDDLEAPAGSSRSRGNLSEARARPWDGPPCPAAHQSDRISPPSPSAPSTWQSWGFVRADHSSKGRRASSRLLVPPCCEPRAVGGIDSLPSLAAHNPA